MYCKEFCFPSFYLSLSSTLVLPLLLSFCFLLLFVVCLLLLVLFGVVVFCFLFVCLFFVLSSFGIKLCVS